MLVSPTTADVAPVASDRVSGPSRTRYEFVDWYRGLACILMFQTHAYDRWLVDAQRTGWFWWTSRHLGGFPSRLFLLLAGVAIAFRFAADERRAISRATTRRRTFVRGAEVLVLGLAFRLTEWFLGGYQSWLAQDILRVDILNCIGLSMMLASLLAVPWKDRALDPWRPALLALLAVFVAPSLETFSWPSWVPRLAADYVAGPRPRAFFPMFPWCSYLLAGVAVGIVWHRAQQRGQLSRAILMTVALGGAMAIIGQIGRQASLTFYDFGDRSAPPTSPTSFFYRGGMCLVGCGLAYLAARPGRKPRGRTLLLLGRTSLLVYWVHVELVYGHVSDRIHHRLSLLLATLLLVLLSASMVLLAWGRLRFLPTSRFRRSARAS